MSNLLCEHAILDELGLQVTQCERHSNPKARAATWVWCARALPRHLCPCGFADRFRVVTEPASINSMLTADVVFGLPQTTTCSALRGAARIQGLPACTLIVVPAGPSCTVLCTSTELLPISTSLACGLCVYPWLVAGHKLGDLA
jgi:hypothetical protein